MLLRPVPLAGGASAAARTVVCDSRTKPAAPADGQRTGAIAPLEQRKLALAGEGDGVLGIVQQIQAAIARLPLEVDTVGEVLASRFVADAQQARWAELSRIPKAYRGLAVGHVAFFGYRPMEVVAYARPADYQRFAGAHLRSLAASHAFWTDTVGVAAVPPAPDDVRRLVPEALSILESFARMPPSTVRPVEGERLRWKLYRGQAETEPRAGGRVEPFTCRFALDDEGRFVHLEAIEDGGETIFPEPYREPGGRPVGEPPSNKGNTMTPEAMRRILERILQNRERQKSGG
jgi:hypothetical protein